MDITPDYEAAARELHEQWVEQADTFDAAKAVVDAALKPLIAGLGALAPCCPERSKCHTHKDRRPYHASDCYCG